jgi:hypothetical protein
MSNYWTGAQLRDKIEQDLDLQDETFIEDSEMLGYINEAIEDAEGKITTLYEDYFLKKAYIPLISGVEEYSLPADIYGMKIRGLIYKSGTKVYELRRFRDWKKFEEYDVELVTQASTIYSYFIINETAANPKILLSPPAKENSATVLRCWYLRSATMLTSFDDTCDLPEANNFIMQFVKKRCYEKEGHPNLGLAIQDLEHEEANMLGNLAGLVSDNQNEIEMDFSHYSEMT